MTIRITLALTTSLLLAPFTTLHADGNPYERLDIRALLQIDSSLLQG